MDEWEENADKEPTDTQRHEKRANSNINIKLCKWHFLSFLPCDIWVVRVCEWVCTPVDCRLRLWLYKYQLSHVLHSSSQRGPWVMWRRLLSSIVGTTLAGQPTGQLVEGDGNTCGIIKCTRPELTTQRTADAIDTKWNDLFIALILHCTANSLPSLDAEQSLRFSSGS